MVVYVYNFDTDEKNEQNDLATLRSTNHEIYPVIKYYHKM